MPQKLFNGIFDTETTAVISVTDFLLCVGVAVVIGLIIAAVCNIKNRCTKSFTATVALLPAIVCVVIMMVNGNIGAGVAVAGAFSLVRFRSAPGTAREIATIFLAMGAGLVCGMGYLAYALLFTLLMCGFVLILSVTGKGKPVKILKITVPEDLNYTALFEDVFAEYTSSHKQTAVKTAAMGTMYKLTYEIILSDPKKEKEFIDAVRTRNGNLEVSVYDGENQTEL